MFEVQHAHGTESTLVAEIKYEPHEDCLPTAVAALSAALAQDCIAVGYERDGNLIGGALYGPKAREWGEFDPAYFVRLKN